MSQRIAKFLAGLFAAVLFSISPVFVHADTININFDGYSPGSIQGQDGWGGSNGTLVNGGSINPSYDQEVVASASSTDGYDYTADFGAQSLRMSDAVTSGSFGDWVFTKPLVDEAGETDAQGNGLSGGSRQNHFEMQFDIASALPAVQQPGMHLSVSPDRGDGGRMSYLRFEDQADGIHIFFDDYQDNAPFGISVGDAQGCGDEDIFTDTDIATVARNAPHTVKLTMDFVDGQKNDVVRVYVDGVLKHSGTSWEGYFNYCEGNPTRTVDSLILQARTGSGPVTNPADSGHGFLIDNLSLTSGPTPVSTFTVTIDKFVDEVMATAENANNTAFPFTATYTLSGTQGSDPFTIGPTGNGSPNAYEARTIALNSGDTYSASENTAGNEVVGATCAEGKPFALDGYSSGNTFAAAQEAAHVADAPVFTNFTSDMYVIVWNKTCPPAATYQVHILKYLDGDKATGALANDYQFPMAASWNASNIGAGTGNYVLGNNHGGAADQYGADTSPMSGPFDYSTSEVTTAINSSSLVVPDLASCVPGKYYLEGYKVSSESFADAWAQASFETQATFTSSESDQYVIVSNRTCPTTGSLVIEKMAIGGNGTFNFTSDIPGHIHFSITTSGSEGEGNITFNNVVPGTYHITEASTKGWIKVDDECSTIVVAAGDPTTCTVTNAKNGSLGEIRGVVYEDWDGDGIGFEPKWEERLKGWVVYLDVNNNGQKDSGEPTVTTKGNGEYRFKNLPAGTYHVREVMKSGWMGITPASGVYDVALAVGQIAKNKDFGNFKMGSISGMKFNDKNGNGKKNGNQESGLSGWTIELRRGTTLVGTTVTNAQGNYSFSNLGPGTYTVREVQQSGWQQKTPNPNAIKITSGKDAKNKDFGNKQVH